MSGDQYLSEQVNMCVVSGEDDGVQDMLSKETVSRKLSVIADSGS